jgi:hypothetical protein
LKNKYNFVINNSDELCNILMAIIDIYDRNKDEKSRQAIINVYERYKHMIYSNETNDIMPNAYKALGEYRVNIIKRLIYL